MEEQTKQKNKFAENYYKKSKKFKCQYIWISII